MLSNFTKTLNILDRLVGLVQVIHARVQVRAALMVQCRRGERATARLPHAPAPAPRQARARQASLRDDEGERNLVTNYSHPNRYFSQKHKALRQLQT